MADAAECYVDKRDVAQCDVAQYNVSLCDVSLCDVSLCGVTQCNLDQRDAAQSVRLSQATAKPHSATLCVSR